MLSLISAILLMFSVAPESLAQGCQAGLIDGTHTITIVTDKPQSRPAVMLYSVPIEDDSNSLCLIHEGQRWEYAVELASEDTFWVQGWTPELANWVVVWSISDGQGAGINVFDIVGEHDVVEPARTDLTPSYEGSLGGVRTLNNFLAFSWTGQREGSGRHSLLVYSAENWEQPVMMVLTTKRVVEFDLLLTHEGSRLELRYRLEGDRPSTLRAASMGLGG